MVTAQAGGQGVAVALVGTWAGNLAYFGLMVGQDIWHTRRALRTHQLPYTLGTFGRNVRALVVEFGVAEVFDSWLIRPALMYWLPRWLHSVPQGIVVANLAADITFYIPTILSYEWSKKRLRTF